MLKGVCNIDSGEDLRLDFEADEDIVQGATEY